MKKPKVCVLRTAGTNCDKETAFAFLKAEAEPELVHINELVYRQKRLPDYHILAIPGGFSYGDDLGAGKILANELRFKLIESVQEFIKENKLVIGICNGFQVLVKSGLLPGNDDFKQDVTLIINDSGKFEDRWVYLKKPETRNQRPENRKPSVCVWTKDLPEIIYLPVAHGEGKFIAREDAILEKLKRNRQIVFQYCDEKGQEGGYPYNPNGSQENIAGICDETGRILGLMPHPERHIEKSQHPRWFESVDKNEREGAVIFRNGVEYARKNLC